MTQICRHKWKAFKTLEQRSIGRSAGLPTASSMTELAALTSADAPSRSRELTEADKDALQRAQDLFDEGASLIRVSRGNSQANCIVKSKLL